MIQLATANNLVVTASDVDMGRSDIGLADSLTRPSIGVQYQTCGHWLGSWVAVAPMLKIVPS
jgi:hypothetical protein